MNLLEMCVLITRKRQLFVLLLVSATSIGCGGFFGSMAVDETSAREACETFLEAWKEGLTPDDLTPQIYGSDFVWASGKTLISFEILPDEIKNGTSMLISVLLTLKDEKGVQSKSKATYTVGTSPVVTVIRDDS